MRLAFKKKTTKRLFVALEAAFVGDVEQAAHPLSWMGRAVILCRTSEKTLKSLKTCLLTANKWLAYLTHLVKGAFQQRGRRGVCEVVLRMAAGSCWWQERLVEGKINSWLCEEREKKCLNWSLCVGKHRDYVTEDGLVAWPVSESYMMLLCLSTMTVRGQQICFESNAFWQFCYISSFALVLSICQLSHSTTGQEHLLGVFFI